MATISGRVTETDSGAPIVNANVWILHNPPESQSEAGTPMIAAGSPITVPLAGSRTVAGKAKPRGADADPTTEAIIYFMGVQKKYPTVEYRERYWKEVIPDFPQWAWYVVTNEDGYYERNDLPDNGFYRVWVSSFRWNTAHQNPQDISQIMRNWKAATAGVACDLKVPLGIVCEIMSKDEKESIDTVNEGDPVVLEVVAGKNSMVDLKDCEFEWLPPAGNVLGQGKKVHWVPDSQGHHRVQVTITGKHSPSITLTSHPLTVLPRPVLNIPSVPVTMRRTATTRTEDVLLWLFVRKSSEQLSSENYSSAMDLLLCKVKDEPTPSAELDPKFQKLSARRFLPYSDVDAYRLLKIATEAFLMVNCGVHLWPYKFTQPELDGLVEGLGLGQQLNPGTAHTLWHNYLKHVNGMADRTLPYLALVRDKLHDVGLKKSFFANLDSHVDLPEDCYGILKAKLANPCFLELIWSYWHEEGMLVQAMNAISRRFQNVRSRGDHDPLARLEIDPLRPLNNILWGYIQDEQHRLTVVRRAYEYDHHYGLTLEGAAVGALRSADRRSKFLEAFHNLLCLCAIFFKEDDDTTVVADGFPVLNALKDVHLILSEGAHNQFGDLPSTARQEMLIQEWIFARSEFREFLPTRIMVAYPEPWMDRVDAMKNLQGWTDVSVMHFHNLGVFGERILLSVRFGSWSDANDPAQATNWARFWRAEIQGYIHAYRAVTGVDVTSDAGDARDAARRYLNPSVLLRQRLALQEKPGLSGGVQAPQRTIGRSRALR